MTINESINVIKKIDIRKLKPEEIEALKTIVMYHKNYPEKWEEIVTPSYILRNYKEE